jgi:hypothetical protein
MVVVANVAAGCIRFIIADGSNKGRYASAPNDAVGYRQGIMVVVAARWLPQIRGVVAD